MDRARRTMFTGMGLGALIGVFISVLTYFRGDIPKSLYGIVFFKM